MLVYAVIFCEFATIWGFVSRSIVAYMTRPKTKVANCKIIQRKLFYACLRSYFLRVCDYLGFCFEEHSGLYGKAQTKVANCKIIQLKLFYTCLRSYFLRVCDYLGFCFEEHSGLYDKARKPRLQTAR